MRSSWFCWKCASNKSSHQAHMYDWLRSCCLRVIISALTISLKSMLSSIFAKYLNSEVDEIIIVVGVYVFITVPQMLCMYRLVMKRMLTHKRIIFGCATSKAHHILFGCASFLKDIINNKKIWLSRDIRTARVFVTVF